MNSAARITLQPIQQVVYSLHDLERSREVLWYRYCSYDLDQWVCSVVKYYGMHPPGSSDFVSFSRASDKHPYCIYCTVVLLYLDPIMFCVFVSVETTMIPNPSSIE